MEEGDEKSYVPRQLATEIRLADQGSAATCVTSGIGRDSLLIRGAPTLPLGYAVTLTLNAHGKPPLSFDCIAEGVVGKDQKLRYQRLGFEQRAHLEELMRPHWDGVNLLDGIVALAYLYGATTLKDWLSMTSLLERIRPRLLNRTSSAL